MDKDIFSTVIDLLHSRHDVRWSGSVHLNGSLYDDAVKNLHALEMLEPSLVDLVRVCVDGGLKCQALEKVMQLIGFER
jgi:hypothetical protein